MSLSTPVICGVIDAQVPKLASPNARLDVPTGLERRQLAYKWGNVSNINATDAETAKKAVRRALDTWERAGVSISFVENPSDASAFVIEWVDFKTDTCKAPKNNKDAAAHSGNIQSRVPVHFDLNFKWVDGKGINAADIESVALHEIGHKLGLSHSAVSGSIMYPSIDTWSTKRGLDETDRDILYNMYPAWRQLGKTGGDGKLPRSSMESHVPRNLWSRRPPLTSCLPGLMGIPAVISSETGRTDIFMRGQNGTVYYKYRPSRDVGWKPSTTGFESLGGSVTGNVAAVSWGPGRIDLFACGTKKDIVHNFKSDDKWSGWESLGGQVEGYISAVSWGPGRIDVFVKGTTNSVYHKSLTGSQWQPSKMEWNNLGGKIIGSPKAVSWEPHRVDVFARGIDNEEVYHKFLDGKSEGWKPSPSGWENLGIKAKDGTVVKVRDDVEVISTGKGRLDIFAHGYDLETYHKSFGENGWVPPAREWTKIPGDLISRPVAMARTISMITIAAFMRGGNVGVNDWNTNEWSGWKPLVTKLYTHRLQNILVVPPALSPVELTLDLGSSVYTIKDDLYLYAYN